jgi:hypothetical protein
VFAFCDQDDVWFPHKLSWALAELSELRRRTAIAAVATDAIVTDDALRQLAPSALALHRVGRDVSLGRLFVNNVAIGATMVGTGRLARVACELGDGLDVRMHDWWCVVVATYGGSFELLRAPTMFWRRHSTTFTGTTPDSMRARMHRRLDTLRWATEAARRLIEGLAPVDEHTDVAARAMADIGTSDVTEMDLIKLRRRGVRAWSLRHDANLFAAVLLRRIDRRTVNH